MTNYPKLSEVNDPEHPIPVQLEGINRFAKLLDNKFRIPGTEIRFGLDFLIGLVPYAGDILSFLFSSGLIITMIRHGASGQVLIRMIFNVVLDTVIGSIPIIGDLFDLSYKANLRNYRLLEEHYGEGEYKGSIWRIIIPILLVLGLLLVLMFWLVWMMMSWFLGFVFG